MPARLDRTVVRRAESHTLRLADRSIPYTLKRSSARRTLALEVSASGAVTVRAPLRMSWRHIESFLERHAGWLRSRLERVGTVGFLWQDGAELPYLGRRLRLGLEPDNGPSVSLAGERLRVAGAPVKELVLDWYRREAQARLGERLAVHVKRLGLSVEGFRLSAAATRWGSLSPRGVIRLNWRLVKASWAEIDYVICHELAHLSVPNHSPAFWRVVGEFLPGFEAARARLRENTRLYFAF